MYSCFEPSCRNARFFEDSAPNRSLSSPRLAGGRGGAELEIARYPDDKRIWGARTGVKSRPSDGEFSIPAAEMSRLYESLLEAAPLGLCLLDREGKLRYVNAAASHMLGWSPGEMVGRPLRAFLYQSEEDGGRSAEEGSAIIASVLERGLSYSGVKIALKSRKGSSYPAESYLAPVCDEGRVTGAVFAFHDASRYKLMEDERDRLLAILEDTPDFVAISDMTGRVLYMNKTARRFHGLPPEGDISGIHIKDSHPDWAARRILEEGIPQAARDGVWRGETAFRTRDGQEIPVTQIILAHKDALGRVEYFSTIARDISEQKRLEAQLHYYATRDALTGLVNRRLFKEVLRRELARSRSRCTSGALLLIDLDHLKAINDSFGHRAGDEVLLELARRLRSQLREGDLPARIGGDEFAVILADAGDREAWAVACRIRDAMSDCVVNWGERRIAVTVSVGIALFPSHGETEEELMARADMALYRAKEAGRDAVFMYDSESDAQVRRLASRLETETSLRAALEQEKLIFFWQPILDLKENAVAKYELLLRMKTDRGILLPGAFLPAAEQSGLIRAIDRRVVLGAVELAAKLGARGESVGLSVNISGKTVGDFDFAELLERAVKEKGVGPGALTLEITERVAITELEPAKGFLDRLRGLGIRFALDDFGAGFSSFESLKELPFDFLKIDGSFIKEITRSEVDQRLVKGIVELAHATGRLVIAEYVGDAETLSLVREMGIDYAQGNYIGKPIPVPEFD